MLEEASRVLEVRHGREIADEGTAAKVAGQSDQDNLAELEAIADDLLAEVAAAEAGAGAEAAEEAAAPAPTAQLVNQCWESAFDHNSRRQYWFNRATGVSQWHPPSGWSSASVRGSLPAAYAPPAAASAAASAASGPGFWYVDAFGVEQGPFSKEQLLAWRGLLPMDLQLWHAAGGPPTAAERAHGVELAAVLGDERLLARWRDDHPHRGGHGCTAPPAVQYEAESQQDTATSLAEAVLAGLPANDEAVQVARLAASTGKSIQEVIEWNHKQSEYVATALHSQGRGRIQAADGQPVSVYSEYSNWVNPEELEAQLTAAAQRRKRPPSGEELRAIKARKAEAREKKLRAWLST